MGRRTRRLQKRLFSAGHHGLAWLAQRRGGRRLVGPLVRGFAWLTRQARSPEPPLAPEAPTAAELGRLWQSYLPSAKVVPIVADHGDAVHAEIRVPCPLRGTGDLSACHALMGYDRALLAAHGGRFEVLRSQAERPLEGEPREVCLVALSPMKPSPATSTGSSGS